jgi:hypothetical protein
MPTGNPRVDSVTVTLKDGRKGKGATIADAIKNAWTKELRGSKRRKLTPTDNSGLPDSEKSQEEQN